MKKKILLCFIILLVLVGCTVPEKKLRMRDITRHPERYVQNKYYSNLIEITGTVKRIDAEEYDQEYKDYLVENGYDEYIDLNTITTYIYLDNCDEPLTTSKSLDIIVGRKYKFIISVNDLIGKYSYSCISADEIEGR